MEWATSGRSSYVYANIKDPFFFLLPFRRYSATKEYASLSHRSVYFSGLMLRNELLLLFRFLIVVKTKKCLRYVSISIIIEYMYVGKESELSFLPFHIFFVASCLSPRPHLVTSQIMYINARQVWYEKQTRRDSGSVFSFSYARCTFKLFFFLLRENVVVNNVTYDSLVCVFMFFFASSHTHGEITQPKRRKKK